MYALSRLPVFVRSNGTASRTPASGRRCRRRPALSRGKRQPPPGRRAFCATNRTIVRFNYYAQERDFDDKKKPFLLPCSNYDVWPPKSYCASGTATSTLWTFRMASDRCWRAFYVSIYWSIYCRFTGFETPTRPLHRYYQLTWCDSVHCMSIAVQSLPLSIGFWAPFLLKTATTKWGVYNNADYYCYLYVFIAEGNALLTNLSSH